MRGYFKILVISTLYKSFAISRQIRRRLEVCENPESFPIAVTPQNGCSGAFVDDDFETSLNGWYGNLGADESLNLEGHTSQYLEVTNRVIEWQGPLLDIGKKVRRCIVPDSTYLFQAQIRLTKDSGISNCKSSGTHCPELKWNHMNDLERVRSWPLSKFDPNNAVEDGTWAEWYSEFKVPASYTAQTDIFSLISIVGPEAGVDISIDNIKIFLPPSSHFPDPTNVCGELMVNGNANASTVFKFPIEPFTPSYDLQIKTDENGNYFSMNSRDKVHIGPKLTLVSGCVMRDGAIYDFSAKIWIHDETPRTSRMIVRYTDDEGKYKFETVGICPSSSEAIGWVQCSGQITFSSVKFHTPPFVVSWMTHGSTAPTDWRDMSLTAVTCGSSSSGNSGNTDGSSTDSCVRNVKIDTDAQVNENITLVITNGTSTLSVPSAFVSEDIQKDTHAVARRHFSFSISGGDWTGSFSLNGNEAWPYFAEIFLQDAPSATTCSEYVDSFSLDAPTPGVDTCNNLIRNGAFEETDDILNAQWYHSGGNLKLVEDGVTGKALSTDGRSSYLYGLVQHLDTQCLSLGNRFDISAKFKLVDPTDATAIPTCDPNIKVAGGTSCPRVKLTTTLAGTSTGEDQVIAYATSFIAGGWSTLFGTFTVNSAIAIADLVSLSIDGVIENIDIVIDDISITPVSTTSNSECIENGDFEVGDTRNWLCEGGLNCGLVMIQPGYDGSSYGMSTTIRSHRSWGIGQHLNKDCLVPDTLYEINAYFKLSNYDGVQMPCDPMLKFDWKNNFCPHVFLQQTDGSSRIVGAGATGPYKANEWNHIYGLVTITSEMLNYPQLEFFLGHGKVGYNIAVDNISVKPADDNTIGVTSCNQLIKNGDAEAGDTRLWYLRGSENWGTVDVVSDGTAHGGSYYFHHKGTRSHIMNGLWQELDKSCMTLNSIWKITAYFKIFDANGNAISCNSSYPAGGCPRFLIEAYDDILVSNSHNEKVAYTDAAQSQNWDSSTWNLYEGTFTMNANYVSRKHLSMYIWGVAAGNTYMVDDITVTKVA